MEPVSAVAAVLISNAINKAMDETAGAVMDQVKDGITRLIDWVRQRPHASSALERVQEAPDSGRRIKELEAAIEAEITTDETARSDLEALVQAVQRQQPENYQSAVGSNIVQASYSTVNVDYGQQAASQPEPVWHLARGSGSIFLLENRGDSVYDVRVEPVGQPIRFEVRSDTAVVPRNGAVELFIAQSWGAPVQVRVHWASISGGPSEGSWSRPLPAS